MGIPSILSQRRTWSHPSALISHSTFQFYEELLEASWQLGTYLIMLGSYSRHIQTQSIFSHQPLMTRVEYVSLTYKVSVCGWSLVGNRNTERKLLSVSSISCNRLLRDHHDFVKSSLSPELPGWNESSIFRSKNMRFYNIFYPFMTRSINYNMSFYHFILKHVYNNPLQMKVWAYLQPPAM